MPLVWRTIDPDPRGLFSATKYGTTIYQPRRRHSHMTEYASYMKEDRDRKEMIITAQEVSAMTTREKKKKVVSRNASARKKDEEQKKRGIIIKVHRLTLRTPTHPLHSPPLLIPFNPHQQPPSWSCSQQPWYRISQHDSLGSKSLP